MNFTTEHLSTITETLRLAYDNLEHGRFGYDGEANEDFREYSFKDVVELCKEHISSMTLFEFPEDHEEIFHNELKNFWTYANFISEEENQEYIDLN